MDFNTQVADLFGITLSAEQVAQFETYAQLLAEWNAHTNLTAIIEPHEVRVRHFLDSLSIIKAAPLTVGMQIVDVGTGAGFPGLPLAIAFPQIKLTLLEATGKKVAFLEHVIQTLQLANSQTLHARAEEAGHMIGQRDTYDLVLARAVARLPALLEYLLPLARVGGRCIAMKGATARDEAESARHALTLLGGRLHDIVQIELPGVEDEHYLVVLEKTDATPAPYPRKPGVPTRKPL